MDKSAICVTGLVPGKNLGVTLPHEHLLIDFSCRYSAAADEGRLGPQPQFVGLDQVNVEVPTDMRGRGQVDVVVSVDSKSGNVVKLNFF